jgi:hypothetical protein
VKHADPRDMFKNVSKSVCTLTVVVFPDPLSPAPLTSSAMKTPENTEEDPDDPEPAGKGDNQTEYSCY